MAEHAANHSVAEKSGEAPATSAVGAEQTAKPSLPAHVPVLFWAALGVCALTAVTVPHFTPAMHEYVVEQYLMLALVPVLGYVLYRTF